MSFHLTCCVCLLFFFLFARCFTLLLRSFLRARSWQGPVFHPEDSQIPGYDSCGRAVQPCPASASNRRLQAGPAERRKVIKRQWYGLDSSLKQGVSLYLAKGEESNCCDGWCWSILIIIKLTSARRPTICLYKSFIITCRCSTMSEFHVRDFCLQLYSFILRSQTNTNTNTNWTSWKMKQRIGNLHLVSTKEATYQLWMWPKLRSVSFTFLCVFLQWFSHARSMSQGTSVSQILVTFTSSTTVVLQLQTWLYSHNLTFNFQLYW